MTHTVKKVKIGIMPIETFKQYTIDIAKGKYTRKQSDPTIWFPSIKSLAHVLSEENQALLRLIADHQPNSIAELEPLTGRKANNLLRTLRTMEGYGLVRLEALRRNRGRPALAPRVIYDKAAVEISLT